MVTINLFPWRETVFVYERKIMQRILLTVLICSVSFVCVLQASVVKQEARLHLKVDALKQEYQRLTSQKKTIQAQTINLLSRDQEQIPYYAGLRTQALFLSLLNSPIHALCFTQINRKQHRITFVGKARSAVDLSDFLQHWNLTHFFSIIKIEQIKQQIDHSLAFRFYGQEASNDVL